jgi:hypothetical protein
MLTCFYTPIKVIQLLNSSVTCSFYKNKYMQKLTKLKNFTNLKLACTQITKSLKERWLKKNDSCSISEK